MATVTYTAQGSLDEVGDAGYFEDLEIRNGGIRFSSVTIPRHARITSATLTLPVVFYSSGAAGPYVHGADVGNAPPWTPASLDAAYAARTARRVQLPWPPADHQALDVRQLVAEIINRPDWTSGNALAFVGDRTGGSVVYDDWDYGNPTSLTITYEATTFAPVTWDAATKDPAHTLSNGNLTAAANGWNAGHVRATEGRTAGKWYFEVHVDAYDGGMGIGLAGQSAGPSQTIGGSGKNSLSWRANGVFMDEFATRAVGGKPTYALGDRVMVAFDCDAGLAYFGKNGAWVESGGIGASPAFDPVSGSPGIAFVLGGEPVYPAVLAWRRATGKFAAADQLYAPPQGYLPFDISGGAPVVPPPAASRLRRTFHWH